MTIYTARQVRAQGIAPISGPSATRSRSVEADAVYVTVDIDVLTFPYGIGTGASSPEGMTAYDLLDAMFLLGRDPAVRAFDLVEIDPTRDVGGMTAKTGATVLLTFLGGLYARLHGAPASARTCHRALRPAPPDRRRGRRPVRARRRGVRADPRGPGVIHFAHGDVSMVGAYVASYWPRRPGLAAALTAVVLAVAATATLGVGIERVIYRPLRRIAASALVTHRLAVSLSFELSRSSSPGGRRCGASAAGPSWAARAPS